MGRLPHHISVCICTFRRPDMLRRLLIELQRQQPHREFDFSITVADNDAHRSAEETVTTIARESAIRIVYCSEPRQNIALARNRAIEHSSGDFIAFIDDDEFPANDWLVKLFKAWKSSKVAGVLGPVRPHFDHPPPLWITQGKFFERPEHPTGTVMQWETCRTGNVLFRREILPTDEPAFLAEFGTGGEDKDFFMRMTSRGYSFIWCNEAVAYETVPPSRWKRNYLLNRALLRGKNILKHPQGRTKAVATSLAAVPAYLLVLPATALFGQARFMNICVRLCDHLGRLLALARLNRINEREM